MPHGINIIIQYDKTLQEITGTAEDPARLSSNSIFAWLLECILIEYPEIEEKYPPGTLYFHVNGYAPKPHSPLFDGDEVYFGVV